MIAKAIIGIIDSRETQAVPSVPPSFVKSAIVAPTTAADSHAIAFSGGVTAGNLIIVAVATFESVGSGEVGAGDVTDSLGNTYSRVVNVQGQTSTAMWLSIHVAQNILGGACTVTANAIGGAAFHTISAHEYSGAVLSNAVDVSAIQRNASSTSAPTPTTSATTIGADLIFAAMTFSGATTTISTPSIGYTQRTEDENGSTVMPINTADKQVAATGTQIATWILGAARESLCGIVAIKGSGTGAPPDTQDPSSFTLSSPSQTSSTISISWTAATDNIGVVGYDIYVEGSFHSTTASLSATIGGLSPSTSYTIYVDARDAAGNTTASNSVNPTTSAGVSGVEIFRVTSTGAGFDYKDPITGLWTAMTLFGGTGILNATTNGVTYKGYIFTNTGGTNGGHPVQVSGDNVIFEYCIFKTSRNVGLRGNGANSLIVRKCLFFDLGIGAWISFSTNLKVNDTQFLNMKYVRAVPAAGSARSGQSVFTEAVSGTGNDVSDNRVESNFGEAYNEDHFNTYASEGTSGNPYYLRRNLIRGGSGSHTGGGMIIGDAGSDYIIMDNNRLVNPGWYGFQIYGGNSCVLSNNYLWSDFTLPTQLPWNRVGFLVYKGIPGTDTCINMSVGTSNVSRYRKGSHGLSFDGTIWNLEDGCSYSACCTSSIGGHNITQSATLTSANMPMPDGSTGFPAHLINYVSIDDYWKLRAGTFLDSELVNSHTTNQGSGSPGNQNSPNVNSRRPTASVSGGPTINISSSSTTLTSTAAIAVGGPGTFTLSAHSWTHVSGPNTPTIVSPTSSSTSVTGMSSGAHVFRYVVEQNNSIYNLKTYHPYWVTVNVS